MINSEVYQQLEREINPTHDIKLFAGRSNPKLAQEVAEALVEDKRRAIEVYED